MKTTLALLTAWWLGGCTALFSYYAVFLAVNPEISMNWWTTKYFLLWPWNRAIDVIAWCL